ncbi:hypothetical protein T440DRAFT_483566 [Plenodomus tracheiphilus IPT5]|uniref:Accumulation-associated protein n=1 Tax=Plenodomus tracheiphilus IPT5 TaxID=1408161 RepID=A0A6A7APM8_9PLEO|nr:hypothetical protein T440DRAFT_483566 [Plenodomus tracheiphilus IPT5]
MHFNALAIALCVFSAADLVAARPTPGGLSIEVQQAKAAPEQVACVIPPAAGEEAAAEEGEGEAVENEVEIESAFDTAVPVEGGDLKQDLVFTPSACPPSPSEMYNLTSIQTVGKFEYEFQAATADEVTVTENTAPAAPPAGFEAIEPNSYIVSLATSKGAGLTLSKIDYIFDATAAGLAGKDVTGAQVGKLCAETGAFVISETLGELEFEVEENEVTLNLNKNVTAEGEWGIFLPVAGAAAGGAAAEGAAKGEGAAEGGAAKEEGAAKGEDKGAAAEGAAKEEGAAQAEAGAKEKAAAEANAGHAAVAAPKQEAGVEVKGHAKK